MIKPLYLRFIRTGTSACAGAPRGFLPAPALARLYSPIPGRRHAAWTPATIRPDGRRALDAGTTPEPTRRKSPANATRDPARPRFPQDCHKDEPENRQSSTRDEPLIDPRAVRCVRHPTIRPSDTQARATRRHSRDPAPAPKTSFRANPAVCPYSAVVKNGH